MADGTTEQKSRNVRAIRDSNEKLLTDEKAIANTLIINQHFATVGERLAKEFIQQCDIGLQLVDRISPTISQIDINEEQLMKQLLHMKHDTATGPDEIPSKLSKTAGISIVPSLMTLLKMSATTATLAQEWKLARIVAVHKKEAENFRDNYRPLSMLCIPMQARS